MPGQASAIALIVKFVTGAGIAPVVTGGHNHSIKEQELVRNKCSRRKRSNASTSLLMSALTWVMRQLASLPSVTATLTYLVLTRTRTTRRPVARLQLASAKDKSLLRSAKSGAAAHPAPIKLVNFRTSALVKSIP